LDECRAFRGDRDAWKNGSRVVLDDADDAPAHLLRLSGNGCEGTNKNDRHEASQTLVQLRHEYPPFFVVILLKESGYGFIVLEFCKRRTTTPSIQKLIP
jgi:hypothetical protein